jgi:hypothetical protein
VNQYLVLVYGVCFSLIAGGAFALMYANIRDIYWEKPPTKKRHPEAPQPGEEIMYVDLSRERLEEIYND